MSRNHPSHTEFEANERRKIVAYCRAMLAGEMSFVEGAALICSLRRNIGVTESDADLVAFVVIESESDHLPLKNTRNLWSSSSLERLKPEFDKTENWARPFASQACENLIKRFAGQ